MLLNDDKNLKMLVDKQKLYKEALDNKISNVEAKQFVDALFENYFLDNDNINFLVSNGVNFFNLDNNEQCFCLSNIDFKDCCFKSLKKTKNSQYNTFLKAIINKEDYNNFLNYSNDLFLKHYRALGKEEVCHYNDCEKNAIENNLYKFDFTADKFFTTYRKNSFDNKFTFGENFFRVANPETFNYYGFCSEHYKILKSIVVKEDSSKDELALVNFSSLLFKLFISRVHLNALKEEFCSIYNSLEGAIKPLYIYNLRKVSNKVSSLINFYSKYKKWMKKEESNFVIKRFILPKTNNFLIQDLVYPQVTPDDFKMVNSINNVFVEEKSALLGIFKNDKSTYVTFIYDKKDEKITSYFNQYWEIIENKEKNIEFFVTNCSLILCDNLLISSDYFNKFNEEEKTFYSALNKFRFENPSMGQEYLKMKFFAGFIKGNNFFK